MSFSGRGSEGEEEGFATYDADGIERPFWKLMVGAMTVIIGAHFFVQLIIAAL